MVSDQDREKSGGRLMLAPSLELPDITSSLPTSAWIEGPNSIPNPVVDALVFPEKIIILVSVRSIVVKRDLTKPIFYSKWSFSGG